MKDETVKIIQKAIAKADDETAALDYIKSALVLDCCEEIISNDGQVVTDKEKPYTIIALNDTGDQYRATNENDMPDKYFYSDLDDLARDIADNFDHIKKVDLVATVKEPSDDED